ncbi:hypothetical protein [Devosia sp.]|uniref:hypothetical protein n=1 Tax=Devosia sp. TaxID=1871048 RepID=UPI003F6EEFC0
MRVSRRPFCFALRARSLATALTSDAIAVALITAPGLVGRTRGASGRSVGYST